jgi:hypothetical protein
LGWSCLSTEDKWPPSLRRHKNCERKLDELFVLIDGVQGTADVVGDVGRAACFNLVGKLKDGGLKGELVFVDLEEQGGE